MDEYGWSTQSFHGFKISYFSHGNWTILRHPAVTQLFPPGIFGSFLGRDLRDLAGGCGSSEAPCGGAANSEAEEAQEVGGSQHQPRREAWEKSMEKNTKNFPWEIDGDWPRAMNHGYFFRVVKAVCSFVCFCSFHGWRCVRCVNLFWVLVAGWCRASRNVWTNFGVTRPGIWLSGRQAHAMDPKWDIKWLNMVPKWFLILLFLFWFCLIFLYFLYFGRWFFRSCSGEFGRFATLASGISIHVRGDKVNSGRPVRLGWMDINHGD